MVPTIDASSNADILAEEPYTLILGLKEMTLLSLILFFGFSGFTLCIDKIYNEPLKAQELTDIKVYEQETAQAYISINTLE